MQLAAVSLGECSWLPHLKDRYSHAGCISSGAVPMPASSVRPQASSTVPTTRPQATAKVRELHRVRSAAARRCLLRGRQAEGRGGEGDHAIERPLGKGEEAAMENSACMESGINRPRAHMQGQMQLVAGMCMGRAAAEKLDVH